MPLSIAAAGASLLPSLFGFGRGRRQRREARRLRAAAQDPGYQMNQGVIDNARILQERASNYTMPGYRQALANINQSYAGAFNRGIQGATSSGDVLDLASRMAYGQGQAVNDLALQNTMGAEQAQLQSLNANAQAGQEYQAANAYQRGLYQQQLAEAAALYNAGEQNIGNALQDVSSVGSAMLMNPSVFSRPQQIQTRRMLPVGMGARFAGVQSQGLMPTFNLPYH